MKKKGLESSKKKIRISNFIIVRLVITTRAIRVTDIRLLRQMRMMT